MRTLTRQLDAAHQQVVSAFATGDLKTIATAVNRGIADAGYSVAKFTRAVNAKVIHEVDTALAPESLAPASAEVSTVNSATDTAQEAQRLGGFGAGGSRDRTWHPTERRNLERRQQVCAW